MTTCQLKQQNECHHLIIPYFMIGKRAVRKHGTIHTLRNIEQVMADEWNNITTQQIKSHYHHCRLIGYTDVYDDCPLPRQHKHNRVAPFYRPRSLIIGIYRYSLRYLSIPVFIDSALRYIVNDDNYR